MDATQQYEYSYSMGVGDAWKVQVPAKAKTKRQVIGDYIYGPVWHGGTIYEYGLLPPRYPVPAIRDARQ